MGANRVDVSKSITAEDNWTEWAEFTGPAALSIDLGGAANTVTVQRSFDGGATVADEWEYDEDTAMNVEGTGGAHWRVGVAAGDYASGTVKVRITG